MSPRQEDAAKGMGAAAALDALIDEVWAFQLRENPLLATYCGVHTYNDRLPQISEADAQRRKAQYETYLARLEGIDRKALPAGAQLNRDILARMLGDEIADYAYGVHRMLLTKMHGAHVSLPDLPLVVPLRDAGDYENYLARLNAFPGYIAQQVEQMRYGVTTGHVPPRAALLGVDEAIRPLLVEDPAQSPLYAPFSHPPMAIPEEERAHLAEAGRAAVAAAVVPAYAELLRFVVEEYLPAARDEVGSSALPEGEAFYAHCVRKYTTLDLSPREVHATGLEEMARIGEEMRAIVAQVGFEGDMRAFIASLRADPRFYVETPEALLKEVALVLKRMDGALPTLFSVLPRMPYGIREVPAHVAPQSTTAYYFPPPGDGSRAGYYYVNTYDLPSRPLYEIEALSLHEAVPGHHLQIALQMELDLPDFRRFGEVTAFIEGWALYAERLGLEVGFYEDPYSDFGRLTYEAWRASRLVVDTGMHALGWTRQQAIDYMAEHTALSLLNIANEVDRYIAWPGQALAYKIGEIRIRGLRAMAEEALGEQFDVRAFHRVVLEEGGIPLDALEARVKAWIEETTYPFLRKGTGTWAEGTGPELETRFLPRKWVSLV
ncbi:MAG: DUF885 domain-containing protein [Anaerolineae bacterium]